MVFLQVSIRSMDILFVDWTAFFWGESFFIVAYEIQWNPCQVWSLVDMCSRNQVGMMGKNIGREPEKRHGDLSNKNGGRIWCFSAGMMGLQ